MMSIFDPPTPEEYLAMSPEERERDFERMLLNIRLKIFQARFYEKAAESSSGQEEEDS